MSFLGLNLTGKASKSTKSSTGTFNNTTTPILPGWATEPVQRASERVGGLLDLDPYGLVAPAHPLQQQAGAGAAALSSGAGDYGAARALTQGAANTDWLAPFMQADAPFASGGKAYNWVGQYLNPYLDQVVDSSAKDFDAHAGQVRAQQALDLAGSGAFGGSGAALTQSMTEGELARARASTLSGLRSHAYETALGAAAGDAERATQARIANAQLALQTRAQQAGLGFQGQQQQLQAAQQLAGLASGQAEMQRANIASQLAAGDALRNIGQQQLSAPVTSVQQIVALLSGLPLGLFAGKNEQGVSTEKSKTKGVEIGGGVGSGPKAG